jgi:diacylglycerol kinase (ATP)
MMPFNRTALLLVNPASRKGSDQDLREGVALLEEAGIRILQSPPKSAEHLVQLIRRYRDQVDFYILGGGDGTISAAAPALYECGKPFAVLPLGTANDLARSVGVPADLMDAWRVILSNCRRRIDLGLVNDHYFFNVAHIGLGVHITYELTPEVKKRWGVFSYLQAFFRALSRKRSFRIALQVDGNTYHQRSIHVAVGNGRFYGGGNIVDERAHIDSGEMCLFSLKPQSLWELLTLAPLLRSGKQHLVKRTFTATGKRIEIRTSRPEEIHADGEPAGFTPAVFKVLPGALEVYVACPDSIAEVPDIEKNFTSQTREVAA